MATLYTPPEARAIQRALVLLERGARSHEAPMFDRLQTVQDYLRLRFAGIEREEMHALYLDNRHALLATEVMAIGTINQCPVYSREIVRAALRLNAAAVLLAHNHPSGDPRPSKADKVVTYTVRSALALVDVRLVDHVVVTRDSVRSAAAMGTL